MGIPKFFRWAAERFPQVITPFKENPPPIDNLYLDMNGIIHHCTHPNDIDATRRSPTEKEMVAAIFSYIEKLFAAIQPRKHFLMAIDGVAPRAKMNQQRQRRYRSGYEMMVAREEALALGEELPDEGDVFDSNCITPGTEFMFRVSEHIQYFITMKITQDAAWRNCTVIYSGHDNPGEGEHKIMDFVRRRKMQPDYTANETHCMYGLDADLMMLALATHEPHFVLLREVVTFGGGTKRDQEKKAEEEAKGLVESKALAKAESFVLFHIGIFREYLELDLKRPGTPEFDIERVIDDFVFMCYFIGNDFLPAIPTLAINEGSMSDMVEIYREVALKKGAYLTRDGKPNWNTIEMMLNKIGEAELETLRRRQEEELEYRKKQKHRNPENEVDFTPLVPITNMADYKQKFYAEKHRFEEGWNPRGDEMAELRQHYIEGLLWVMEYYYHGPPSWKWFYPHHYAPLASDLVNLSHYGSRVRFDKGDPFLPHQQLLAVLPPMSAKSLPAPYWPLLTSNNSPLRRFFPAHLEIDKEGARNPWEGTVLIPFIDEAALLAAYESVQSQLSEADRAKNKNTHSFLFRFNNNVQPYTFPSAMFEPLQKVQVERKTYKFPEAPTFIPRLMPGVRLKAAGGMEGFASFYSKQHLLEPVYEAGAVNIFGFPTKKESLLLRFNTYDGLTPEIKGSLPSADDFRFLIGQKVWIAFPFYKRARLAALTDSRGTLNAVYDRNGTFVSIERKDHTSETLMAFKKDVEAHQGALKAKCGLVLPSIPVLVQAHRQIDMRISKAGRLVPQYSKKETVYPLQLISPLDKVDLQEDPRYIERDRSDADYQTGTSVLYIGPPPKGVRSGDDENPCYGCTGYVMEQLEGESAFDIALTVPEGRPRIPANIARYASADYWYSLKDVSDILHLPSAVVSQICSSIVTTPQFGSQEMGLGLKFTGRELARVGYAKLVQTHFNPWYVSRPNLFGFMAEDEDDEITGYHLQNDGRQQPRNNNNNRRNNQQQGGDQRGQFASGKSVNAAGKGTWFFSDKAVQLLREYNEKFRPLVQRMEEGGGNTSSLEPQSFMTGKWADQEVTTVLKSIEAWLTEKGIHKMPMANAGDDCLPDDLVGELERFLNTVSFPRATKSIRLRKVQSRSLYFPTVRMPEGFVTAVPLPIKDQRFVVGSRIVHCRTSGGVPFGAEGTVIRLLGHGQSAEVVFDEPFVGGSTFGGRLKVPRGSLVKLQAMLLLDTRSNGLSPEAHPLPTPSPSTIAPEIEGFVMPASVAMAGGSKESGAAFDLGGWAAKMGLGSQSRANSAPTPGAVSILGGKGVSPPPEGAKAPVPSPGPKTPGLSIPAPKSQQGKPQTPATEGKELNVLSMLKAASAAASAPPPPAVDEGIRVAEKLSALGVRTPNSPPPAGSDSAPAMLKTTSSGGGVNMADVAKRLGATPNKDPSPSSIPTPSQPFSGDVRLLQAQLGAPQQPARRLDPIGLDEETILRTQKEKEAAQQQAPPVAVAASAGSPGLIPKPRSHNPEAPPASPDAARRQLPQPSTPTAAAAAEPGSRLTEGKIASLMAAMVKAQLDIRYGSQSQ